MEVAVAPVATVNPVNPVDPVGSLVSPREITLVEPQWLRVAAEIRDRIRSNASLTVRTDASGVETRWLPPYPDLQDQHRTSYGTLRTVLIRLEAEGWIERRPGVGLLVREDHPT